MREKSENNIRNIEILLFFDVSRRIIEKLLFNIFFFIKKFINFTVEIKIMGIKYRCPKCGKVNKFRSSTLIGKTCIKCSASLSQLKKAEKTKLKQERKALKAENKDYKEPFKEVGILCFKCKKVNAPGYDKCQQCGESLKKIASATVYYNEIIHAVRCSNKKCNAYNEHGFKICRNCGKKLY